MPYDLDDTIAAVASAPGGAARGIVRMAGPHVVECLQQCFVPSAESPLLPSPSGRGAGGEGGPPVVLPGSLRLDGIAGPLPCDLYLWPGPRSYTGGPAAELHTLGSPPLLEAAVRTLCRVGARLAEPGEFTLRAFLSGRIDLTEAEAVLGVVDAVDPAQLHAALAQLAGGLARPLGRLRSDLLELLAHLEAGFDFADEDLPFITPAQLAAQLQATAGAVAELARQMASRGDSSGEVRAVLRGAPNTGKSSLFNALAGRMGAIVSHLPGTTRDYLTAGLDLDGAKCRLIDTAGVGPVPLRATASEGVQQAARDVTAEQTRQAHVQLLCLDSTRRLDAWEKDELASPAAAPRLLVLTKCDLPRATDFRGEALLTSSVTGQGLDALRAELRRAVLAATAPCAGAVGTTAVRCGESVRLAGECLHRAVELARAARGEELIAAEVRTALDELGKVAGEVSTDDVLDRVFSRFCIGK